MSYIYGPIPSRRLGQSLGVDPVPLKTCNWNCIYCQLGRTVPLVNARREYVPRDEVIRQLANVLSMHEPGEIDWISFVGSGEPTLHSSIGWMIRRAQDLSEIPVAVITNGALLYLEEVREDLMTADVVMPTLAAGSPELYRRLHRPHPDVTFACHLEGLHAFRRDYSGTLWVEVMLVQDVNDTPAALQDLAPILAELNPDEVHITLPDRPPSEPWVNGSDAEGLMRATAILGAEVKVMHPAGAQFDLGDTGDMAAAVLDIVTRHPMSEVQLNRALAKFGAQEAAAIRTRLEESGALQLVERHGARFWTAAPAHFPAD